MAVSPPAVAPGSDVTLSVILANQDSNPATPQVILALPANASLRMESLPAGTSFNVQANSLNWQPVIPGGGADQLLLQLSVNVADLKQPEQTIIATLVEGNQQYTFTATYWVGIPPQATIRFDPPQAAVGQPVQLLAEVVGPGPMTQLWTLGDGRVVDAENPVVVFPVAGTYPVTLQLSNPLASTTASGTITIIPQALAAFSLADTTAAVNQPITFVNQSGGELPLTYLWNFGDGSTSTEASPVHTYAFPGTYQVQLIAGNAYGQSSALQMVTIGPQATAELLIEEVAVAGQLLSGQILADGSATRILWDMGDGQGYEGGQMNHVYWSAGDYLVTVTVSNDYGDTQLSRWVHVEPGILFLYLPVITNSDPAGGAPAGALASVPQGELATPFVLQPLELPATTTPVEGLFIYVNEARRQFNVPALNYVYELSVAAQTQSNDMAAYGYTGHAGSDGSSPAWRIRQAGYPGGYGGEAAAWGMPTAVEAVEFWVNSPAHRNIILNPAATDLGVGYTINFDAPNIWYWVAEFASLGLPVVDAPPPALPSPTATPEPVLQLLGPPQNSEFVLAADNYLIFTWSWTEPLQPGERFAVYLQSALRTFQIGAVQEPTAAGQYQLKLLATAVPAAPGDYQWQVRLENLGQGATIRETAFWPVHFLAPVAAPATATPTSTATPPVTEIPD